MYADLKADLARRFPDDRRAYIAGKDAFVLQILAGGGPSAFGDFTEDRFHIDDRGAVEGLQVVYLEAEVVDGQDGDAVEAERIGAVRRARAEDTGRRSARVAARMHLLHTPIRSIEPGDENELVAGSNIREGLPNRRVEHDPGVRRTFIPLPRRIRALA
ncbi:hypothetical protein JOF29_003891 [Kribbella aluminosa]|uniref:Uncharacterized protein n=1 Tax=Kribbella aluminosa TaxID=416017 RepID=A0ABS4UMC6_9ACTN|nr:hypothetical protein [Kribbella aluminosa]